MHEAGGEKGEVVDVCESAWWIVAFEVEGCGGNLEGDGEELDALDAEDYGFRTLRRVRFWECSGSWREGMMEMEDRMVTHLENMKNPLSLGS